jgi:TusE/DsrC/DsvC family sulfur relay protein
MKCYDPSITRKISLEGKDYLVNDRYYLKEFSAWDKRIRDWLAAQENLHLGPEQLHVIEILRAAFEKNRRHPVIRTITTELQDRFGTDKGSVKYFHRLFPGGIHQAFLLAGLPMQDSCC